MPTYEYTCSKCHHVFELTQSIKDPALTICPKDHCARKTWGKGKIKRSVGGGSGLLFKGSGFYITDYRSESYKASAKKDVSPSSSSSSSESKPAKTDGKPSTPAASPPKTPAPKPAKD